MESLALILFYISLIGILVSIGLIIYNVIKKEFKHKKKKLLLTLVAFVILFIGSTIFYGVVQSPESKAEYEASQKAKTEEAKKESSEKEKKEEKQKQEQAIQKEKSEQEVKAKEEEKNDTEIKEDLPAKTEVKEETPKTNDEIVITSEPNTTAAVNEIINKGKEDASKASEEDIKKAIQFINNNYNNYWIDNETMHKGMYYGSLLEYAKKDKAKENPKGIDGKIYDLGVDTVQVIKYVYRGVDKIEDDSTQANLRQIEKSLNNISNNFK